MSRTNNIYGLSTSSAPPIVAEFIMLVKTDNSGTSGSNQFTIPTTGAGYNYTVETTEELLTGRTGATTLTWALAGTYQVKISGTFPRIFFNNTGDRLKLLEVQNWGTGVWTSFVSAFYNCANMQVTATDIPNLSSVLSLQNMFRNCTSISTIPNLDSWNMSNITSIEAMFQAASSFNQNISTWNVSNITNMRDVFFNAPVFNQNLSAWTLANSITMLTNIFRSTGMNTANYTDTIVSWANKAFINSGFPNTVIMSGQAGRTFTNSRSGGGSFANAGAARTYLTGTLGWTISGDTVI